MSDVSREQNAQKKLVNQDVRISALKKQLVYYKEITETVREPFLILDQDLKVVTANVAFYRKFKVKKQATEGQQIYELGNNQWEAPEIRVLLENILPTHGVLKNYAVTHNFPTIGKRTILLNAKQVDSKQLILLAMEDITEQLRLKADSAKITKNLIKQRNQLQSLSDAKDEFVSLASHQLRTPATAVKQYLSMLDQGYAGKLTEEQTSMLGVAYKNNERQLEIIEDLLRVAKVDSGKVYKEVSLCDIASLIESVIEELSVLFKSRKQVVVFEKPKISINAYIDPKLMRMVFENLLDNAGKYSQENTTVDITIHKDKKYVIITITDHGVGIRKIDQPKLYKKFSRINNPLSIAVPGTGLGLYWVEKIIELHQGEIKVTSKINKGTSFAIYLPK